MLATNSKAMLFAILHSFVSLHFKSCNKTEKYGLLVLLQFEDTSEYLRESA